MLIQASDLLGDALDYAVNKALAYRIYNADYGTIFPWRVRLRPTWVTSEGRHHNFWPSVNGSQLQLLKEGQKVSTRWFKDDTEFLVEALIEFNSATGDRYETPIRYVSENETLAVLRAVVLKYFPEGVDIPEGYHNK